MGITDTEQKAGEIWVWVPFGVKHISIGHPTLGFLRDYYFPCSVEEARTYEMVLITGKVNPIVEEDLGGNYLMLTVEPKNAMVYIDDKLQPIENGELMPLLPYGHHTYRVEAPSYMNEAGAFEIGKERTELNVRLVSAKATLTVNCPDAEADIYLNDQKKGRGSWTGQLAEGMYAVEARKSSHRSTKQSLTLAKQEQKTVTLNAPQPIYGKLNLTSTPGNCEVFLDGKQIGKSPNIFSDILIGNHNIELRKNGYDSQSKAVSIEEGKITDMEMTLQRTGSVAQQPEVQQPQPQQNEKPTVQTDKKKTIIIAKLSPNDAGFTFGLMGGRVNKIGWYASCLSDFGLCDVHISDEYTMPLFDLTAGTVFRCGKLIYFYIGAGLQRFVAENRNHGRVKFESGIILHYKGFSILAGANINHESLHVFPEFGLGYNF